MTFIPDSSFAQQNQNNFDIVNLIYDLISQHNYLPVAVYQKYLDLRAYFLNNKRFEKIDSPACCRPGDHIVIIKYTNENGSIKGQGLLFGQVKENNQELKEISIEQSQNGEIAFFGYGKDFINNPGPYFSLFFKTDFV